MLKILFINQRPDKTLRGGLKMSLVFCSSFYVETVNAGLLKWHIFVGKSRMDRGACGQTSQDGYSGRGAVHSQVKCQGKESKVVHEESGEHWN